MDGDFCKITGCENFKDGTCGHADKEPSMCNRTAREYHNYQRSKPVEPDVLMITHCPWGCRRDIPVRLKNGKFVGVCRECGFEAGNAIN